MFGLSNRLETSEFELNNIFEELMVNDKEEFRRCPRINRGHSIITFALSGGEGEVHQNANLCQQGGGGVMSMQTFTYKFF